MPNRIEREIEEILTRLDEFVPEESRSRRARRRFGSVFVDAGAWVQRRLSGISGGHVVLAAAFLLLLAMFLGGTFPTLTRWMTIFSLLVIFSAIVLSIRPIRRGRSKQPYWRGQPVDLRAPGPFMRLRMWWRRRNSRL